MFSVFSSSMMFVFVYKVVMVRIYAVYAEPARPESTLREMITDETPQLYANVSSKEKWIRYSTPR